MAIEPATSIAAKLAMVKNLDDWSFICVNRIAVPLTSVRQETERSKKEQSVFKVSQIF